MVGSLLAPLFYISCIVTLVTSQKCADELKGFQTCIESWASQNPPPRPPSPPTPPKMEEVMGKVANCFKENGCTDPTTSIDWKASGEPKMGDMEGSDWMDMKRAKYECAKMIAEQDFAPTVENCVRKQIPGWVRPVESDDPEAVFDPYGEGPMSKHFMERKRTMMENDKPEPPMINDADSPRARARRHMGMPPPWMGKHGPGGPLKMEIVKLASAVYDTNVCPTESREKVSSCLDEVSKDFFGSVCTSMPNKWERLAMKVKTHTKFCENRDVCFNKISKECRNDFWDQKWFMARCFQQAQDAKNATEWDRIENKFDTCMEDKGFDPWFEDDDEDADADASGSSEETTEVEDGEGKDSGSNEMEDRKTPFPPKDPSFRRWILRKKISMQFRDGPIRNPCRKIDGIYEMMLKGCKHGKRHRRGRHHHGHHHGPPPPFGGPPPPMFIGRMD